MRLLSVPLVLSAVTMYAGRPAAIHAQPIKGAPKLTLTEELRVDPRKMGFDALNYLVVAPDGRIVLAPSTNVRQSAVKAYDSTMTKELWRLDIGRGDAFELRFADRIGWTGTQMWIADRGYDHVVLVDDKGKVTKSIENPEFARPPIRERDKYPVYGGMSPLARFADGSMLIRPFADEGFFDTPNFDASATHILHISRDGIILKTVATYPPEGYAEFKQGNRTMQIGVPFQSRTFWTPSLTGTRLLFATAVAAGKDSAMIRVTVLNERGDTVVSRRHPFTTIPIPQRVRDSAMARVSAGQAGVPLAEVRAEVAKLMPRVYPTLSAAVLGNDGTIWLGLRAAPGDTVNAHWLMLNPQGDIVGTTTTHRTVSIVAATATHVWTVERQRAQQIAIAIAKHRLSAPKPQAR